MNSDIIIELVWKLSCMLGFCLILQRCLKHSPSVTKHALLLTCVLLCLALPFVSHWAPGLKVLPATAVEAERPEALATQSAVNADKREESDQSLAPSRGPGGESLVLPTATAPALAPNGSESPSPLLRSAGFPWASFTLWAWLSVAAVLAVRVLRGQWRLSSALRSAGVAPAVIVNHGSALQKEMGISQRVAYLLSSDSHGPLTVGLLRPKILLPIECEHWSEGHRAAILAHELMHVKRWDLLAEHFRTLFGIVYWFHPLAHVVSHQLHSEQELACDDGVVSLNASPTDYAACLVSMAPLRSATAAVQCHAGATPMLLEKRVCAILDRNRSRLTRLPNRQWLLVGLLTGSAFVLGAGLAPVDSLRSPGANLVPDDHPLRSRSEFAAAMNRVRKGMPEGQLREILGDPDDIKTQEDPKGITTTHTKEIWRYGTNGHLSKATLGEVYINTADQVQYMFGRGTPIAEGLVDEAKLRDHIRLIARCHSYNQGQSFNPLHLVRAVNALQPLGKQKALAILKEYLRISSTFHDSGREGVFLILRALFDIPDTGFMKRMLVGASTPEFPKNPKLYPRFPLHIHQGLPLLLSAGYLLAGFPEQPEQHLKYFEEIGVMRAQPLVPPTQPVMAVIELLNSPEWIFNKSQNSFATRARGANLVGNQVLRMMRSVYRRKASRYGSYLPYDDEAKIMKLLQTASQVDTEWDATESIYRREDGSILPPELSTQYRRFQWKPGLGGVVEVVVERKSSTEIEIAIQQKASSSPSTLKVLLESEPGAEPVASFKSPRLSASFKASSVRGISSRRRLAEGTALRLVLQVGEEATKSASWKP